jgi:T5SS/PEP-CTERM-associated repeat protein
MAVLPTSAAIVTLGEVNPDPGSGLVDGTLNVAQSGTGSLTVNAGSTLSANRLTAAAGTAGDGSLVVSGVGSSITTAYGVVGNFYNTNIGSQGRGSLSVLDGASFVAGLNDSNCQLNCGLYFSNAAGSNGQLLVSGAGSTLSTPGAVRVGHASRFTAAVSGFDYGTAGGASQGFAEVLAGGSANSSMLSIGSLGDSSELTGTETSTGRVVVDGASSVWNVVRNAAQTGTQALLRLATSNNTNASLEVRNGGVVRLDGSSGSNQLSGANLGTGVGVNGSNARAAVTVTGVGSRLEINGSNGGFLNVGRGQGSSATLDLGAGGVVTGSGANASQGLSFMSVGRNGGTGTVNISGTGSLLRLSGSDAAGSGAFLQVGRLESGLAGNGSVSISQGGRLEIDTRGVVLPNANGQTGMFVGVGAGSSGSFSVSGAGSVLSITADSGMTPYVGIGRDGATGSLTVSGGGRVEMSNSHVSAPNTPVYLPGDVMLVDIGRRFLGNDGLASTGTLTVTGSGSAFDMGGTADRLIQVAGGTGGTAGAQTGQVVVNDGGLLRGQVVILGTGAGASGSLSMNNGQVVLDSVRTGGPGAGQGPSMIVGRGGAVGSLTMDNGSTMTIASLTGGPSLILGGTSNALGGTGQVQVRGGSTLVVDGADAGIAVGRYGDAANQSFGTLAISGAGSTVTVSGSNGRMGIGAGANSTGTVIVGAGATLNASSFVGVAHNGTASSTGTGSLVVNGTVNTGNVFVGSSGTLGGSGVINGNVTNFGTLNPGNSPGRLTINGAFDNTNGRIVLEVQSLGGGQYAVDELVFGDPTQVQIGLAAIDFVFLGDTDPLAFQTAGLLDLDTFFKQVDGSGHVVGLAEENRSWFAGALFSASAASYVISGFSFDPITGASHLVASAVPLPPTLTLALLGLAAMAMLRTRRRF